MDIRKLTDDISVSPQIAPADVADIAAQGFRTIVCNRPDGESFGQPACGDVEAEARKHGLAFVDQPVISGQISVLDVERFGDLYAALEKPVLAYCRSGTRCTVLWALSQAGTLPADEILERAAQAGYDLSGLAGAIAARHRGG